MQIDQACESHLAVVEKRRALLAFTPQDDAAATDTTSAWLIAAGSVRGPSHLRNGAPRQDAFAFANASDAVVACVCDGLGSQGRSHIGAKLAAELVAESVAAAILAVEANDLPSDLMAAGEGPLGDAVRGAVSAAAREAEVLMALEPGPGFAATIVGVVAHPLGGFFFHVGDGVGLAYSTPPFESDSTPVISAPENGDFDDVTFAIDTDPADPHLRFTAFAAAELIVLMTDGPMAFALGRDQASLADGLFRPLEAHLWAESSRQHGGQILVNVLRDPRAGEISDDDKTLLVLRRASRDNPPTAEQDDSLIADGN